MFKYIFILVIIILIIAAFAGVEPFSSWKDTALNNISGWWQSSSSTSENVTATTSQITITNSTTTIVAADYASIFNEYRISMGYAPLEFTDDLNRVAELRLKELYTDFSHYSIGNYNNHLAENIAMSSGFLSNSSVLSMWQNSPGHNANLLDSSYRYTGYAIGNGYAVQVFSEFVTIDGVPQLPPGWYWTD
jgi:uncharacterized protein YkwD